MRVVDYSLPTRRRGLVAAEQSGEFGPVGGADFGAGPVEVALNGADGQGQPLGDLAVGQSPGGPG